MNQRPTPPDAAGADPAEGAAVSEPGPSEPKPSDLGPHEARISSWLSGVESKRPPADLEAALLDAYASALRPRDAWPRPATWVGALGAVLLVGLGLGGLIWSTNEAARRAEQAIPQAPRQPAVVVDDPSVPLYSGIDSFDSPDAAGDAVISSGDRGAEGGGAEGGGAEGGGADGGGADG